MAHFSRQLPWNSEGICMVCKMKPGTDELLWCGLCFMPWHISCVSYDSEALDSTLYWECPHCTIPTPPAAADIDSTMSLASIAADRQKQLMSGAAGDRSLMGLQWIDLPEQAKMVAESKVACGKMIIHYKDCFDCRQWSGQGSGKKDFSGNELQLSCINQYPVRVVSNEHGNNQCRALALIPETEGTTNDDESLDEEVCMIWRRPTSASKLIGTRSSEKKVKKARGKCQKALPKEKILKGLSCLLCKKVMTMPVTTPCRHNFCKRCLENAFAGKSVIRERLCLSGQILRSKRNVMKCPSCPVDISGFLTNPQVNKKFMDAIEAFHKNEKGNELIVKNLV